jgi:protease YdgD
VIGPLASGRAVVASLVVLCGLALPVLAQNSGLDALTRREETLGWEAVGRVEIGTAGYCTGTLIATDLVLTAAHCLFDPATGAPQDPATLMFRAGLGNDVAVAEARVQRAVAHPGYDPAAALSLESIQHDAALLHLAEPIPAAVAAPFVVQFPDQGTEVSVLSYARGRDSVLSWQRRCTVLGQQEGLLAFDCDVDRGSSGAPVFDRSGGRARIVSIISSGTREGRVVSLGMVLPDLVADLKAALRSAPVASAATPRIRRLTAGDTSRETGARFVRP